MQKAVGMAQTWLMLSQCRSRIGCHCPPPPALLVERAMGDTYKIKVIKADTGEVVKTLEATTERLAERVERGLNRNMNHSDYYTVIEPPKKD